MKANKKTGLTREAIKEFNESRKGLEVDLMDEVLKSRRTAWMVATGSAVVTVFALSLVGYVVHKYSQPIPAHLLTLNEATHEVQQVKLTRDQTSYGDEIDKFWRHCCKVSDEAAFCLIQRPYISKTLLTRRISPRGSP